MNRLEALLMRLQDPAWVMRPKNEPAVPLDKEEGLPGEKPPNLNAPINKDALEGLTKGEWNAEQEQGNMGTATSPMLSTKQRKLRHLARMESLNSPESPMPQTPISLE